MRHPARPAILRRLPTWQGFALAAMAAIALAAGVTGPQAPAYSEAAQINRGKQVYMATCAKCHGAQLEGQGGIPRLAGSGSRVRSNYVNAQQLYDFISVAMPFDKPGGLKKEEYWDVTAFLWYMNGVDPGPMVVDASNAARLTWNYTPAAAPAPAKGDERSGADKGIQLTGGWIVGGVGALVAIGATVVFLRRRPQDPAAGGR